MSATDLIEPVAGPSRGVAIIGMAGRFPGAGSIGDLWQMLRAGSEGIRRFSEEELAASGIDPSLLRDPGYVRARGVLPNIDLFDASFFGFSPREAEITDPQQRIFLECAWEALEDAGYVPRRYDGRIGVYAGAGWNSYLLLNLASHRELLGPEFGHQTLLGNEKDNLPTRISYKLNLKGPSINVQTGCSTSLVAACLAYDSLLNFQCDIALAGGVSISSQQDGYVHRPGGIFSPDGHCRAFDAMAAGTVPSSGVGIVVLKRLEDAIADRDGIYAVIQSAAVNNDGGDKAGYTAPSVEGQAAAILEAQMMAGFPVDTITYVEAHGTATALGDPIEIAALTSAFRAATDRSGFCAIGSVKTNIGHVDTAAGVAGLIKTALAIRHAEIPPSLHFDTPNPRIDFAASPFYVNTGLVPWSSGHAPRRAGVSSFGLGGTNAHLILEQAPEVETAIDPKRPELLVISARTGQALENITTNLACYFRNHPEIRLADVAHTLRVGREAFGHRRVVVCRDVKDAVQALEARDLRRVHTGCPASGNRTVAFMFAGQGAQYPGMARELYDSEPAFRVHVDACFELYKEMRGIDLRAILYAGEPAVGTERRLHQTKFAQPLLFIVEYALARMWNAWGVEMAAAIGHSIGEYVAATLAGVLSLDDALALVAIRAELMQEMEAGAMLAVASSESELRELTGLAIAAVNEPASCVVSGTVDAVASLRRQLRDSGIASRFLNTSHAFHSEMMEPMLARFAAHVARVRLLPPRIPFISNVTGTWITAAQATDVDYWVQHVRRTVRFADGLRAMTSLTDHLLLEVGPGRTLSRFATRSCRRSDATTVLSTLPDPAEHRTDEGHLLDTLGQIWLAGVEVDWQAFSLHHDVRRAHLPTYPFERERYWIDPVSRSDSELDQRSSPPAPPAPAAGLFRTTLVRAARECAHRRLADFDGESYRAACLSLDALCTGYMNRALRQLGAFENAGDHYAAGDLPRMFGVVPRFHQLVVGWLEALVERGDLRCDEQGLLRDLRPVTTDSMAALVLDAQGRWAAAPQVLELVQTCGEALIDVLRGDREPLELLISTVDPEAERSHCSLLPNLHYAAILRTAVADAVRALPSSVRLRILEVGGGTGIATREILPVLPPDRTSYTFTDVGQWFLTRARERFGAFPFISCGLLDLNESPVGQGYAEGSFDVVIAVNMLHATRSIPGSLDRLHTLLAPGGLLLIWEITHHRLDFDLTYGLLMDPVEDLGRSRSNPFLSEAEWRRVLATCGFENVASLPDDNPFGQHIVIAQRPATVATPEMPEACTLPAAASAHAEPPPFILTKKADLAEWFHVPSWRRSAPPVRPASAAAGCSLVFVDHGGLGLILAEAIGLREEHVVTVSIGACYERLASDRFIIDPERSEDYDELFGRLIEEGMAPARILHLWSVTSGTSSALTPDRLRCSLREGLTSLLFIAQTIENRNLTQPVELIVVSSNIHDVTGDEIVLPEKAPLLAACRVIPLEYANVASRNVDIVMPPGGLPDEQVIELLLREVEGGASDAVVAYRGAYRWVQGTAPVRVEGAGEPGGRLRRGGVYLITGGLGRIGLSVADYLASTVQARLVLTGRSAFPSPQEWDRWLAGHPEDDPQSRRIQALRRMEMKGAELLIAGADVADGDQMRRVLEVARARFGEIHGVVHAAGILGDGAMRQKNPDDLEKILAAKVAGTIVLDTLLAGTSLDFFVLFSSLSAIRPGFGQIGYSAANNFLDAFVHSAPARRHRFCACIDWDVWQGEGMAYDAVAPQILRGLKEEDFRRRGILPDEGIEIFARVLGNALPHVLISTSDYLDVLESNGRDLADLYLQSLSLRSRSQPEQTAPRHARPRLDTPYDEPRSEVERTLAGIWRDLLGIEGVGVLDDFFALGGDSLIGTQMVSRIRSSLGLQLPTKSIYLHPTIRSLSEAIEGELVTRAGPGRIGALLDQLE